LTQPERRECLREEQGGVAVDGWSLSTDDVIQIRGEHCVNERSLQNVVSRCDCD
jgi:hypothetical protein